MLCINGRISWPLVFGITFSTIVVVAADIVWRAVQTSYLAIIIPSIVLLLAGNALILIAGSRSGKADQTISKPS